VRRTGASLPGKKVSLPADLANPDETDGLADRVLKNGPIQHLILKAQIHECDPDRQPSRSARRCCARHLCADKGRADPACRDVAVRWGPHHIRFKAVAPWLIATGWKAAIHADAY